MEMNDSVKSNQSTGVVVKAESRRLQKQNHSALEVNSVTELPEIKDQSSLTEKGQVSLFSLQNDFVPDELLTTLTSSVCTQGKLASRLIKTNQNKVCGIRPPDAVWHHEAGRKKYQYFIDQPTSVNGAGRDISFLCDALATRKQQLLLPPIGDTNYSSQNIKNIKSLIPSEYHIVTNKGVKALQCFDDKFTVLLEDEDNRPKVFPSMKPSGRLEAMQLMRMMDDMLDKAGVNQELEEITSLSQMQGLLELVKVEQKIYNIVFHELIRQVSVECSERGQVLAKLRQRYVTLLDRIPRQLKGLHTETLAQKALDRRLVEEILRFKQSIAQLFEELTTIQEHDEQMSKQVEETREELSKALEQSQFDSDAVGEYHNLYKLQRERLEGQVTALVEQNDLWSKVTYSLALKVIKVNDLQLINRLHVSERTWNETAEKFVIFISAQDSEDLNYIMQLASHYKEQLMSFMMKLSKTESQQHETLRSIQNDIIKWQKFCETPSRTPDLQDANSEELIMDLKQWLKLLTMQCERYEGETLWSGQEALMKLAQLQKLWMGMFLQLFRRHQTPDKEPPQGQTVMTDLCHTITELYKQLEIRINGESGIYKQLTSLAREIDSWTNKLETFIEHYETLKHFSWVNLKPSLESWIELSEEALLNVSSIQHESEKEKEMTHTKIEENDIIHKLRQFLSLQNTAIEYENLILHEEVRTMHLLRTRWMVDLLLLIVPDQQDDKDPSPNPQLNTIKNVSHDKLEEDARNLYHKLNYLSKYITSSCQIIVQELMKKEMPQDEAKSELKQLKKLQRESSEWVEVCQILMLDLMGRPVELHLARKVASRSVTVVSSTDSLDDEHTESKMPTQRKKSEVTTEMKPKHVLPPSLQADKQAEEPMIDGAVDEELKGSVVQLIGYNGLITEKTMGEESLRLPGTSELVLCPHTENAKHAFSALATLQVVQKELLTVEARAVSAEQRAMKAEEALQAALWKIYDLEGVPQSTSPEPQDVLQRRTIQVVS